jgi:hypothetical protein
MTRPRSHLNQRPILRVVITGLIALVVLAHAPVARADAPPPAPAPSQAKPVGAPPDMFPPAPTFTNPPPPAAQPMELHQQTGAVPAPAQSGPPPAGQWTFTQQYGWLWMPYDQRYTNVVDDAALAYEYVWYPTFGWTWVVAPWVLGFGVTPYWGAHGPGAFAWYAHPWFRVGTAHLRPSWGAGAGPRGSFGRHGFGGGGHGRR